MDLNGLNGLIDLPCLGRVHVPIKFRELVEDPIVIEASRRAGDVLEMLRIGQTVVVTSGDFEDLRILVWYVMRYKEALIPRLEKHARPVERMERQEGIRNRINHLLVPVQGESLVGIDHCPSLSGLHDWASWDQDDRTCLVPARRIMRIITDMRRSTEGIEIRALGNSIVVFPQVYVPFDQSIVDLLDRNLEVAPSDEVLDMGTGTGILALLAAKKGAQRVVAVDILDKAILNARENARRLGLDGKIEVRGPCDLFECVPEKFDSVIFNPPWIRGDAKSVYEGAQYDRYGDIIERFLTGVGTHLKRDGCIYLFYSDISDSTGSGSLSELLDRIEHHGLKVVGDVWKGRRSRISGSRERVHLYRLKEDKP
jgi:release factor glutamine methyltransferase